MILAFVSMRYREVKGHWPLMKRHQKTGQEAESHERASEATEVTGSEPRDKAVVTEKSTEIKA